jgi:FkbH-like protein
VVQGAGYVEQFSFSKEDQLRAGFYKANALRAAQLERIGDHDEYLRSLGMTLSIAPFDTTGRKRIAQLISKSNQFNLTTRRYSETEIAAMQSNSDVFALQARLEDIFGDNGMISAVICRQAGPCWEVDTWIMSCRVLGRRVEETILQYLVEQARSRGITEIIGRYIPTAKNGLVRDHFSRLGFVQIDSRNEETTWRLSISSYCEKNLPLKVDLQKEREFASAGRA